MIARRYSVRSVRCNQRASWQPATTHIDPYKITILSFAVRTAMCYTLQKCAPSNQGLEACSFCKRGPKWAIPCMVGLQASNCTLRYASSCSCTSRARRRARSLTKQSEHHFLRSLRATSRYSRNTFSSVTWSPSMLTNRARAAFASSLLLLWRK